MRSPSTLAAIQRRSGSYQRGRWQKLRRQFYSYVQYPLAGASRLIFFGNPLSSTNSSQLTNIPKAGSFGTNHFLVKSIHTDFFLSNVGLSAWNKVDTSTIYADILYGLFSAGVLQFGINARSILQLPQPFYYAPPAHGTSIVNSVGAGNVTAAALANVNGAIAALAVSNPPTQGEVTAIRNATEALADDVRLLSGQMASPIPHCELARKSRLRYNLTPSVLIEAEQTFEISIDYPDGALPVLATDIVNVNNPLYVGVLLDGIVYRPVA